MTVAAGRWKPRRREEYSAVKHDACFSRWKVLLPAQAQWPTVRRSYSLHNLPQSPRPGVYELGITTSKRQQGSRIRRRDVTVVYIGRAENVRQRLQSYGQGGSHLELGAGLFSGVLAHGYSIVFRWATVGSKEQAKVIEAQLLAAFDYAWNKGSNGARRPLDAVKRLKKQQRFLFKLKHRFRWMPRVGICVSLKKPQAEGEASGGCSKLKVLLRWLCCLGKSGRGSPPSQHQAVHERRRSNCSRRRKG